MPNPHCVKCRCEMVLTKVGVTLVELFSNPPRPYKMWGADLFTCPGCGVQVIDRRGQSAYAANYQPGFLELLEEEDAHNNAYYCYETPQAQEVTDGNET